MNRVPAIVWAFILATFVSNIGTHMQSFSEQWIVILQAGSEAPRWAGRMSAAAGLGIFSFMILGGWIADHAHRGKSLAIALGGLTILALVMAMLAWQGRLHLHGLVSCAFIGGICAGLIIPLQLSLVGDLQPENASLFGLMQVQWNFSRILGPFIAAFLFARVGPAGNFLCNSLSFLPLIAVAFYLPNLHRHITHPIDTSYRDATRALWAPGLRDVMVTAALSGLLGYSLLIFTPVYGARFLGLSERGVAGLLACFGIGAIMSGMAVTSKLLGRDSGKGIRQGLSIFAISLICMTLPSWWMSPVALFTAGFGSVLSVTSLSRRVREQAPTALLGRINALYSLAIVGLSPIGSLAAGEAAQLLGWQGPRWVLGLQGIILLGWCSGWVQRKLPSGLFCERVET